MVRGIMMCECGEPAAIYTTSECMRCYHRRYYREHHKPKPPAPKRGATPETSKPCSYFAAHSRVRAIRGLPSEHECTDCGQRAEEWAYRNSSPHEISGTVRKNGKGEQEARWSPLVWDYDPMCKPCHRTRDAHLLPRTAGRPETLRRNAA